MFFETLLSSHVGRDLFQYIVNYNEIFSLEPHCDTPGNATKIILICRNEINGERDSKEHRLALDNHLLGAILLSLSPLRASGQKWNTALTTQLILMKAPHSMMLFIGGSASVISRYRFH